MRENVNATLYLDERRIKANKRFPLKLRLYQARTERENILEPALI